MTTITREDGTQFVTQSYRELLLPKSATFLKTELRTLAQTNGRYAKIFKQRGGQMEAVFSPDAGYLLGETVWQYFNKPYNLVFCEAHDGQFIVVIVKNGMIYLDALLSQEALQAEMIALSADTIKFDVKVHGKVPFGESVTEGALGLPANSMKSFTPLGASVFAALPEQSSYLLQDIEQAINAARIGKLPATVSVGLTILLMLSAWWLWPASELDVQPQEQQDPYLLFEQALATPAPAAQLNELIGDFNEVSLLSGWEVTNVQYNSAGVHLVLHSTGGPTRQLITWAQSRGFIVQLTGEGAEVYMPTRVPKRALTKNVLSSLDTLSTIIDRMMEVVPSKTVTIGEVKHHGLFKTTDISIQIHNISTDILGIIAKQLAKLPITLQATDINVNNALFTGTVKLTVIGS